MYTEIEWSEARDMLRMRKKVFVPNDVGTMILVTLGITNDNIYWGGGYTEVILRLDTQFFKLVEP
jgi:hypothetical protein